MADRQPATQPGSRRLGRYELIAEIARGGMGTVLLARLAGAGGFQRLFAVKLLHKFYADDSEFVEMLLDEARIAARIHHPNVVSIQEVEQSPEHGYYLVMDYVEGFTLWDLSNALAQSSFKQRARIVIRIVLDALNGLEAAHTLLDDEGRPLGVVHRDVSPQNILVAVNGIARVTDFGIAKAATRMTTTRVGQVKGKLAYMAPEQAKGQPLDIRADVWAVAVVLWESLTGRRLFKGTNDSDTYRRVLNAPVPRLNEMFAEAPPAISDLMLRALERDAGRRIGSAREFSQSLEAVARGHSLLADPHEISAWIRERFASELATRREAIKQAAAGSLSLGEKVSALPGGIHIPQLPEKSISLTVSPGPEVSATADVDIDEPSSVTKKESPAPDNEPPSVTKRQNDAGPLVPRPVANVARVNVAPTNPSEFDEVFDTVVVNDDAEDEPSTEAAPQEHLIEMARVASASAPDGDFDDQSTSRMDPDDMSPGVKAAILAARQLMGARPKVASGPSVEVDDNSTTEQGRNPLGPRPVAAAAPVTPAPMKSLVATHNMPAVGPAPSAIGAPPRPHPSGSYGAAPAHQSGSYGAASAYAKPAPSAQQHAMNPAPPMQATAMQIGNAPTLAAFGSPPASNPGMPPGGWAPSSGPTMPPPNFAPPSAQTAAMPPVELEPMRRSPLGMMLGVLVLAALGAAIGYIVWQRLAPSTAGSAPVTTSVPPIAPAPVVPPSQPLVQPSPVGPASAATPTPALAPVNPTVQTPAPAQTPTNTGIVPGTQTPTAAPTSPAAVNASSPSNTAPQATAQQHAPQSRARATGRRPARNVRRAPPPRRRLRPAPARRRSGGVIDTPPM